LADGAAETTAVDGAAEAAFDGAVDDPDDPHAANTKAATTVRPAIRVTVRCLDKIDPPL